MRKAFVQDNKKTQVHWWANFTKNLFQSFLWENWKSWLKMKQTVSEISAWQTYSTGQKSVSSWQPTTLLSRLHQRDSASLTNSLDLVRVCKNILILLSLIIYMLEGGILGLFTGMSILSMVEVAFWIVRFLGMSLKTISPDIKRGSS